MPDIELPSSDPLPAGRPTRPVRAPGLGFLTARLTRQIVWLLGNRTAEYGVMPAQFPVLRMLYRLKTSTQGELARLSGIEQPTMAATLKRMEKGGLIQRVVDEGDARRRLVSLTPHGEDMLHRMTADAHDVYDEAVEGLSPAEIEQFLTLCVRMTDNLERQRHGRDAASGSDDPTETAMPFA